MSARARAAAVLVSLGVLLAPVPVAADEPSHPDNGDPAATPAEEIAEALADSPVYVDPAYDTAFPEADRERIATQVADGPMDLYVIAIPLASGDHWDGDPESLIGAVNDRMGGGERHFLAYEQTYKGSVVGEDFGSQDSREAFYGALASEAIHRGAEGASIADRVDSAVEVAFSDDPQAGYEQASEDYQERAPEYSLLFFHRGWVLWAAGFGVAAVLAGLGFLVLWRRRGSTAVIPQHAAFDNADRARLESLVERCERDLIELGERLSAATDVPEQNLSRALDARDAAARVHDQMVAQGPTLADAAGVLVLLDRAEDALAGGTPRRPCYANPLHGSQTRPVQWREFGGTRSIRVPLCAECAKAVRNRVRPTVLAAEHEGRSVPYYELPPEESVWAATGFGALTDDLVQRILSGQRR